MDALIAKGYMNYGLNQASVAYHYVDYSYIDAYPLKVADGNAADEEMTAPSTDTNADSNSN